MADAQASGACGRKIVWVQVPSPALFCNYSEPCKTAFCNACIQAEKQFYMALNSYIFYVCCEDV